MKMRIMLLVILTAVVLTGCKTIVTQKDVVLLPEDRIYTVPAGTKVQLVLDKKPLGELTFPYDMKLVHASILERNEQQLNDAAFAKVRADKDSAKRTGIIGGILTIVGAVVGIWGKGALTKKKV